MRKNISEANKSKVIGFFCFALSVALLLPFFTFFSVTFYAKEAEGKRNINDYLEVLFNFDDESNALSDSSGKNRTIKLSGDALIEEGRGGRVLHLKNRPQGYKETYAEINSASVKKRELTIMSWVMFDTSSVGSKAQIFSIDGIDGYSLHLTANSGSEITGYQVEVSGIGKSEINADGLIPRPIYDGWNHVAVTTDGSELKFYVNAALIGSVNVSLNLSGWIVSNVFLGKSNIWNSELYNGYLDDFRVYSAALDSDEISFAAGFTDDTGVSEVKLLSGLKIDGEEPTEFNPFLGEYYKVIQSGSAAIPVVTADAPFEGATIEVVQAKSIPGTAYVYIYYPDKTTRTVTVEFVEQGELRKHPGIDDVTINDQFWNDKLKMFTDVTAPYVLDKWVKETHDNLRNFDKVAAGHRNTQDYVGSMTWGESDFYASMAGACRLLRKYPNESLKNKILNIVDHVFAASESVENGYFSIYDILMTDGKVFSETSDPAKSMALFNLGYLLEFGISLYDSIGDARILRTAIRFLNFTVNYSNHGKRNFIPYHTGVEYNIIQFSEWLDSNPHVRENEYLSDLEMNTDDYMELADHFMRYRGVYSDPDRVNGKIFGVYGNDHLPFTKISSAAGHIVEANLLYFAIAEYARRTGESDYINAAYRIWENITDKQLYVTGGAGVVHYEESYGGDYNMPNESYTETCTSAAMMQYSDTLSLMFSDSKYHDVFERILYNNLLGGIGAEGRSFFYTNPLATYSTPRYTWHPVPCCTKYGLLIFGDLPRYIYSYGESSVYVDQFIGSTAVLKLKNGDLKIVQEANWAQNGFAQITVESGASNMDKLYIRLPDWSSTVSIFVNGKKSDFKTENGFAVIEGLKDGDTVSVTADMTPFRVYANENVEADVGRVALQKGPLVYCMEGIDNKSDLGSRLPFVIIVPKDGVIGEKRIEKLYGGVTALTVNAEIATGDGYDPYDLTLIPWYARSNRGDSPIYVWLAEDRAVADNYTVSFGGSVELKSIGAEYNAITNMFNPKGAGNPNYSVIVDGNRSFSSDSKQFDGYGATLMDALGNKNSVVWFGIQLGKEFNVSHIVFWEGGHWTNGGWFGDEPYVQVMVDNRWVDVKCKISPDYPEDVLEKQLPANEAYIFTLETPINCTAVRILGKQTAYSGHHVSCAEIEVYGSIPEDKPAQPSQDNPPDNPVTDKSGESSDHGPVKTEKNGLNSALRIILIVAGGFAAFAISFFTTRKIKNRKER